MEENLNPRIIAYLVAALICSWVIIIIALAALLTAWRKIKDQVERIGKLVEESAGKSNSLREKGCEIDRLEKTINNLIKQKQRRRM